MYFHTFRNDSSQQTALINYVIHEINMNSYQCSAKNNCFSFTASSIIMIFTFSSDISSITSAQVKTLTYKLSHMKQEQKSSIMKLVKTLTNKDLTSEFSKKSKIKNASDF